MQNSIKTKILDFLKDGQWKFGGQIEDHIRETDGHKASNASRRCRELEDDGRVESRYVNVPGVTNKVVQYRLGASMERAYTEAVIKPLVKEINKQSTDKCSKDYRCWHYRTFHYCGCVPEPKQEVKQTQSLF